MRKIVEKSMLGRAWVVADDDNYSGTGEDELLRHVLSNRGISDADAEKFLNPSVKEYMPDPFVLRDMQIAAQISRKSE